MKKIAILLMFGLILIINQAYTQVFTNLTVESTSTMLCDNFVNTIATDPEGNIWFGTPAGVSKFDGTNWTTYTEEDGLVNNNVGAIAIDADGSVWFGTSVGVSKFDGTTWTTYTTEDGLASNKVQAISIDPEGNIWFGTSVGVSKFDGTNWTTYTEEDGLVSHNVGAIAIDAEGNIWFGCGRWYNYLLEIYIEGGVSRFNGTNWTTYTTADGLVINDVDEIAIDAEGNKWFGTYAGVSKFDATNWTTYTTADGLVSNDVSTIAIDAQDNKWFGTSEGVSKFDGTSWTNYTFGNNIFIISDIVIDLQGNKWLSIFQKYSCPHGYGYKLGKGVLKFDDTNWTNYTTGGLSGDIISTIAIDAQGNKWIGAWGQFWICDFDCYSTVFVGVSKFDDTNWITDTYLYNPSISGVEKITIDAEGNIWFVYGSDYGGYPHYGVSKFDDTTWTTYTTEDGLADYNINDLAIDFEGNIWFGTPAGVSKFIDTTWTTYTTEDGLASNRVNAIAIDSEGNKWFGCSPSRDYEQEKDIGGGVSKFDGTTWTTYTTEDGLASNNIDEIAIDAEGNKWFGTPAGVSKFNDTTWTTYTAEDGLASNDVSTIAIDAQDNKWFGTYGGVSKFDGTNWTTYTEEDGLANNNVNTIAVDAEGNIWFGTAAGVSKLSGDGRIVNISVSPVNQDVGFDAGSTEFNVTSNAPWTMSNDADWLTLSRTSLGTNAIIIANFTENNSPLPRVATITIYGPGINTQYVTVTQEGIKILSVLPVNQNVNYEAGDTTFSISSNTSWTISDDADWLEVNPTNGSGDGIITVSYSENPLTESRIAAVIIIGTGVNSDTVSVTQSGNPYVSAPSLYDLNAAIYPNPVKDNLFIKFDDATLTDISISVFDICGRQVIQRNFEHIDMSREQILDLSFIKSGIYFLEIKSEWNSGVYKIIKE